MNHLHGNEGYLEQEFRLPQALLIYPDGFKHCHDLPPENLPRRKVRAVLDGGRRDADEETYPRAGHQRTALGRRGDGSREYVSGWVG